MGLNLAPLIQVQIISATFGNEDFTTTVRHKLLAAQTRNPSMQSCSIWQFFSRDPNPNVYKVATVVWRNTLPSAKNAWSQPKSIVAAELESLTIAFDGLNDTVWEPPRYTSLTQNATFILAAYWWKTDVTNAVAAQVRATLYVGSRPVEISISESAFGTAPSIPSNAKRTFCATYGLVTGNGVRYGVLVGNPADGVTAWSMGIPAVFPPPALPTYKPLLNYVTFDNPSEDRYYLIPKIADMSGLVVWKGEDVIPPGQSRDIFLVDKAGCIEGNSYWLGFDAYTAPTTATGTFVTDRWMADVICTATTSTQLPSIIRWFTNTEVGPVLQWEAGRASAPSRWQGGKADLRLNIYACVYGGADCTQWLRQQYATYISQRPPTDTANSFSFQPSGSYFGDPQPNKLKICVVIYRLAYAVSTTDGILSTSDDANLTDTNWSNGTLQPFHTASYPVLQNISGFRSATAYEDYKGGVISIDLNTVDRAPFSYPPNNYPFLAAALWQDRDVTSVATTLLAPQLPGTGTMSLPISASANALGGSDPLPDQAKQMVVLYGIKMPNTPNNPAAYTWVLKSFFSPPTIPSYNLVLQREVPTAPVQSTFFPAVVQSRQRLGPTYKSVTFVNGTDDTRWALQGVRVMDLWPVINYQDAPFWDSWANEAIRGVWRIMPGQNKIANLIADAGCVPGESYTFSLRSAAGDLNTPRTKWVEVSATPKFGARVSLVKDAIAGLENSKAYDISLETSVLV